SRITSSAARGKRGCGKWDCRIAVISARSNRASATCLLQLDRRQSRIVYDPICSQWLRGCRASNPRGASSGRAQPRAPAAHPCLMRRERWTLNFRGRDNSFLKRSKITPFSNRSPDHFFEHPNQRDDQAEHCQLKKFCLSSEQDHVFRQFAAGTDML